MRALARVVELQAVDGFADRERTILAVTNEVCRRVLTADLQQIADAFPDEVEVEGLAYRRHEPGTVSYHSLCGELEVTRHSYRQAEVRNGPTVVPMELQAGIIEGATPALAHSVAQGIAELPSRKYDELLRAAHRYPPSRSTVERLAKGVGGALKQDVLKLEAWARSTERLPRGAHAISIGLDRTSVPMAEEREPGQLPRTESKKRKKPRVRRAPPPIDVCYRMAYVGTVAVVDRDGRALVTRKYGATVEEGPDELVGRVMADVTSIRRERCLPVVVVQDGAPELWGLMWTALRAARIKWRDVLDRYHVAEHMVAAVTAVVSHQDLRKQYIDHWLPLLDKHDHTVRRFVAWLETFRGKRGWSEASVHQEYLDGWSGMGATHYRSLRLAGFPIASGVTEGACKSLIAARFKRSGQRWQQDGLSAILTLRAMSQSERFERVWPLFIRRFQSDVQCTA